ncbi:MAG: TlpA family protein disulfide reductase [Bacteroides sp.]|nr:TlpA family protein disulfide reductase [Bacteroides sp.]
MARMKLMNFLEKYSRIFIAFAMSILLFLLCTPFRAFRIHEEFTSDYHSAIVGFVVYYLLTYLLCKRFGKGVKPSYILYAVVTAIVVIQLPVRIVDFRGSMVTLAEQTIYLAGCILGFTDYKKYLKRWQGVGIGITFYLLLVVLIQPRVNHYLNFGTFTGKVQPTTLPEFRLVNSQGDTLSSYSLSTGYTLLDVWSVSCGICIRSFPKVEAYQKEIESKFPISVYTLNLPVGNADIFSLMEKWGYNIPTLQIVSADKKLFQESSGIKGVPTYLIINRQHELLFRGDLKEAKRFIKKLFDKKE